MISPAIAPMISLLSNGLPLAGFSLSQKDRYPPELGQAAIGL
jgi:hypothetical protein